MLKIRIASLEKNIKAVEELLKEKENEYMEKIKNYKALEKIPFIVSTEMLIQNGQELEKLILNINIIGEYLKLLKNQKIENLV